MLFPFFPNSGTRWWFQIFSIFTFQTGWFNQQHSSSFGVFSRRKRFRFSIAGQIRIELRKRFSGRFPQGQHLLLGLFFSGHRGAGFFPINRSSHGSGFWSWTCRRRRGFGRCRYGEVPRAQRGADVSGFEFQMLHDHIEHPKGLYVVGMCNE